MESPDDQTILNSFGHALEKLRNERGLSQRELAAIVAKDQAQIVRYEKGEINPTLTTIIRLAEALQIDPCQLLS